MMTISFTKFRTLDPAYKFTLDLETDAIVIRFISVLGVDNDTHTHITAVFAGAKGRLTSKHAFG